MQRRISSIPLTVVLLGCIFLSVNCSKHSTGPEGPEPAFSPDTGQPGTVIIVSNLDLDGVSADSLRVCFGDQPAPAFLDESDNLITGVPLFLDDEGYPDPPSGAVDLVVYNGGVKMVAFEAAVSVTPLPESPGAAEEAVAELNEITESLDEIFASFITGPGAVEQYSSSVTKALSELVGGDGTYSLNSAMEELGGSDAGVRILDGLLGPSGILDYIKELSSFLEGVVEDRPIPPPGLLAPMEEYVDDEYLATQMQFYVVVKMFGEQVIKESNDTFAKWIATSLGIVGLSIGNDKVNPDWLSVVCGVMTILEFVVNKVIVGALPATIHTLDVDLASDTVKPGESTDATMSITALNDPPDITLQYLISYVLSMFGAHPGSDAAKEASDLFIEGVNLFLGILQAEIAGYADSHPELELDVNLSEMPPMSWNAIVDNPALLDCMSETPDIVEPIDDALNWRAADDEYGEGRVYVLPSTDSDAHLIPLYTGGSFGEDMTPSATRSVFVKPSLALELDFPATLDEGESGILEVRAGYYLPDETVDWSPGIEITVTVNGGHAEESSGVTGDNGNFFTTVYHDGESDEVEIHVEAEGAEDSYAHEIVTAAISGGGQGAVVLKDGGFASAGVGVNWGITHGEGENEETISDEDSDNTYHEIDPAQLPPTWSWSSELTGSGSHPKGGSVSCAGTTSAGYSLDIVEGHLNGFSAQAVTSGSSSVNGCSECESYFAYGNASARFELQFRINGSGKFDVVVNGNMSCEVEGPCWDKNGVDYLDGVCGGGWYSHEDYNSFDYSCVIGDLPYYRVSITTDVSSCVRSSDPDSLESAICFTSYNLECTITPYDESELPKGIVIGY